MMNSTRLAIVSRVSFALAACQPASAPLAAAPLAIASISPEEGPVGTEVTLAGSGFMQENTIVFGSAALSARSPNDAILKFTVPGLLNPPCFAQGCRILSRWAVPGPYPVFVRNANGKSNSVVFTIR
jgi:hypothetical protein